MDRRHARAFLHVERRADDRNDPDFDAAIRAYQFIPVGVSPLFGDVCQRRQNINAKNAKGQSILAYISGHARSEHYVDLLKEAGAQ